jgi:hypothetical protein
MISAGNSQAISNLALVFGHSQNKPVFVEEPSYFLAFDIFKEQGLRVESLPMDQQGLQVRKKAPVKNIPMDFSNACIQLISRLMLLKKNYSKEIYHHLYIPYQHFIILLVRFFQLKEEKNLCNSLKNMDFILSLMSHTIY